MQLRRRVLLKNDQTLKESLSFVESNVFSTLLDIVPCKDSLSPELTKFCDQTFVLDQKATEPQVSCEPPDHRASFDELIQDNLRSLFNHKRSDYVQAQGHECQDFALRLKNLNFGKTILETSLLRELCGPAGTEFVAKLLMKYAIFIVYKGEYIQVTGKPLNDFFGLKSLGDTKRKKAANFRRYSFHDESIPRFQMFYCTHINRSSGLFKQNPYFDKGTTKSPFLNEVNQQIDKFVAANITPKRFIKPEEEVALRKVLTETFERVRELFSSRRINRKHQCKYYSPFDLLLFKYCRLSPSYKSDKEMVEKYIRTGEGVCEDIFERLYASSSSYNNVTQLLKNVLKEAIPVTLIGCKNLQILKSTMLRFVSMKRFQNSRMEDYVMEMDVFEIPWLKLNFNPKHRPQIIGRGRNVLGCILGLIFAHLILPLMKHNFYITEKHKEANKIFYYRKPLWILVAKLSLKRFSSQNLEAISRMQHQALHNQSNTYPEGKLRILPKKGTFRPIITFNRKLKYESEEGFKGRANLNQLLCDTQLVLRNLKNILGQKLGYCIFDNQQVKRKYDDFVRKWRKQGSPELSFFTLDIKKCYDSIDTKKLIRMVEKTDLIEDHYLIEKYSRFYRNKRPLKASSKFSAYFNFKERLMAVPLSQDPMEIKESHHIPAFNIFQCRQRSITREQIVAKLKQLCEGSVITYRKRAWLQRFGIPQGLNVSGVLCSLYFAILQHQYVKIQKGLLMRLTDDYLYLGPQDEAKKVLDGLLRCARENSFIFNSEKISKNFEHPELSQMTHVDEIVWIGKRINLRTLQMRPHSEMTAKLGFAMNVNLNKKSLKSFLKNKLKSLLTNHFASYYRPELFSRESNAEIIKLYVRISLQKFIPFCNEMRKVKGQETALFLLNLIQTTFHEFIVYATMLSSESSQSTYNRLFVTVATEACEFLTAHQSFREFKFVRKVLQRRISSLSKTLETSKMVL